MVYLMSEAMGLARDNGDHMNIKQGLGVLGMSMAATFGAAVGVDAVASAAPTEDSVEWSCASMGNRVCSPTNQEGMLPGHYSINGLLDRPWSDDMFGMV